MKRFLLLLLCAPGLAFSQSSCPAPTPGSPKVCLKWTASTSTGVTYNIYRSTTTGGENYSSPLNTTPISGTQFYDSTVVLGSTYFYTAVSVGTGGVLSTPTPEVSVQIPVPPAAPTGFSPSID